GLVQAQAVAQADHHAAIAGGQVVHGALHEALEARVVEDGGIHAVLLLVPGRAGVGGAAMVPERAPSRQWRMRPKTVRSCHRCDARIGPQWRRMDTLALSTRPALHVSLVALPDAAAATLFGIHDVMNAFALMGGPGTALGNRTPFEIEIVGERAGPLDLVSGVPVTIRRGVDQIDSTDIIIVPSVVVRGEGWVKDRYPGLVRWARAMHERGALLCSACSGIFLLAETGLFD